MPSVLFSGTDVNIQRGAGFLADNVAKSRGGWLAITDFSVPFQQGMAEFTPAGDSYRGIDTEESSAGNIDHYAGGTTTDITTIATGSYTGWLFFAEVQVLDSTACTVYWRKAGESTLQSATSDSGDFTDQQTWVIGSAFGSNAAMKARSWWYTAGALTEAQVLAISQDLTLAALTGQNSVLLLNDHTTAGVNAGTGGNFTINGTLSTAADEPNAALPSGAAASPQSRALAFAANF